MRTERVRLGTMLTPLSRRRPWKVASEVVTLDHLSNGRVILPVGLGAAGPEHVNSGFPKVGELITRGDCHPLRAIAHLPAQQRIMLRR